MQTHRSLRSALLCTLLLALFAPSFSAAQSWFRRGDAGGDGRVDVDDAIFIDTYLFLGGPAPQCFDAADANDDDNINNLDAIYILNWVNGTGPAPLTPGPLQCGPDPSAGTLTCATYSCDFIRGDADGNGTVDALDATAVNNYLFVGGTLGCLDAADANDDGVISQADAVQILTPGGLPLPGPLTCGPDYTRDTLDCQIYAGPPVYIRGDADNDGILTTNDSAVILAYLFTNGRIGCLATADVDGNGTINQPDAIYLGNFLTATGPAPPAPFPICAYDATTSFSCDQKQCAFIRGDADGNGQVDQQDTIAISNYLFTGGTLPCLDAADANDDGVISNIDSVFILNTILGAAVMPAPGPHVCGIDPTADNLGCGTYTCVTPTDFRRGDCNTDGNFDISDPVFILGVLFPPAGGGNTAGCQDSCDANDDGNLNISDPIRMLTGLFGGAIPLPEPFRDCGLDTTPLDALGCVTYGQLGCP